MSIQGKDIKLAASLKRQLDGVRILLDHQKPDYCMQFDATRLMNDSTFVILDYANNCQKLVATATETREFLIIMEKRLTNELIDLGVREP